jgi:hypothetical protein
MGKLKTIQSRQKQIKKTYLTMQTVNNTIANTEVELNEGLFVIEMEDRLETVEFASAATNSVCRDREV